jgi:hypothetical protein
VDIHPHGHPSEQAEAKLEWIALLGGDHWVLESSQYFRSGSIWPTGLSQADDVRELRPTLPQSHYPHPGIQSTPLQGETHECERHTIKRICVFIQLKPSMVHVVHIKLTPRVFILFICLSPSGSCIRSATGSHKTVTSPTTSASHNYILCPSLHSSHIS